MNSGRSYVDVCNTARHEAYPVTGYDALLLGTCSISVRKLSVARKLGVALVVVVRCEWHVIIFVAHFRGNSAVVMFGFKFS